MIHTFRGRWKTGRPETEDRRQKKRDRSETLEETGFSVRWLKPTAKDIAANKQFGRSERYLLPSALADGQDLHPKRLLSIIRRAQNR